MMLGLLLARAGVEVVVLEKHADFLRDFRGDTLHPSTLEVMHELGLLEQLLRLPHEKIPRFSARFGEREVTIANLSRLQVRAPFIAMMPQWDFLDFLAGEAKRYAGFRLRMKAEVTGLIERDERIVGVRLQDEELQADLVIGADGRHSTVRAAARLAAEEFGVPMDVLWFRLSRRSADPGQTMGLFGPGRIMVLLNRAIQDAVATANILAGPLRDGTLAVQHLQALQQRRDWPTRITQRLQLAIQKQLIARALSAEERFTPPLFVRLLATFPILTRIPARLIGLGVRPEHVRTPPAGPARAPQGTTG